jgi:hypothetical protein
VFARVAAILVLNCLAGGAAEAGTTPDRPLAATSGALVGGHSLELEVGGRWADGVSVPALVKFNLGGVEPRLAANLSGVGAGAPALVGGLKLAAIDGDQSALAVLVESALPVGAAERWTGQALLALSVGRAAAVGASFNAGLRLQPDGDRGVALAGFPVAVRIDGPVAGTLGWLVGANALIDAGFYQRALQGGLFWAPAEQLAFDGAVGWEIDGGGPVLHLGVTLNTGRLGG